MASPVLTGRNAGGATVSVSTWIPMRTPTSAVLNGGAANAAWRATATSTAVCGPLSRITPVSAMRLIIRPRWAAAGLGHLALVLVDGGVVGAGGAMEQRR